MSSPAMLAVEGLMLSLPSICDPATVCRCWVSSASGEILSDYDWSLDLDGWTQWRPDVPAAFPVNEIIPPHWQSFVIWFYLDKPGIALRTNEIPVSGLAAEQQSWSLFAANESLVNIITESGLEADVLLMSPQASDPTNDPELQTPPRFHEESPEFVLTTPPCQLFPFSDADLTQTPLQMHPYRADREEISTSTVALDECEENGDWRVLEMFCDGVLRKPEGAAVGHVVFCSAAESRIHPGISSDVLVIEGVSRLHLNLQSLLVFGQQSRPLLFVNGSVWVTFHGRRYEIGFISPYSQFQLARGDSRIELQARKDLDYRWNGNIAVSVELPGGSLLAFANISLKTLWRNRRLGHRANVYSGHAKLYRAVSGARNAISGFPRAPTHCGGLLFDVRIF